MSSDRIYREDNAIEAMQAMYKRLRDKLEHTEKVHLKGEKTEIDLLVKYRDVSYILLEIMLAQRIAGDLFAKLFDSLAEQARELQIYFENELLSIVKELREELKKEKGVRDE